MMAVFISYRRASDKYVAAHLSDTLKQIRGDGGFLDVTSIPAGAKYPDVIRAAVLRSDVVLAIIGVGWLTAANEMGGRRLDEPDDFVRVELTLALEQKIRVIPVLIDDATMPAPEQLAEPLRPIVNLHYIQLRYESWSSDVARLCQEMDTPIDVPEPDHPEPPDGDTPTPVVTLASPEELARESLTAWATHPGHARRMVIQACQAGRTDDAHASLIAGALGRHIVPESRNVPVTLADGATILDFDADGALLAIAGQKSGLGVWDLQTDECRTVTGASFRDSTSLALHPTGRLIAWSSARGDIHLIDVQQAIVTQTLKTVPGHAQGLCFLEDGSRLTSISAIDGASGRTSRYASRDVAFRSWQFARGEWRLRVEQSLTGLRNAVSALDYAQTSGLLAAAMVGRHIGIWDATTGLTLFTIRHHPSDVLSLRFSPDGQLLAAGFRNGAIYLYALSTGMPVGQPMRSEHGEVGGLAFSPDGKLLAAGCQDGTLTIWMLSTRRLLGECSVRTLAGDMGRHRPAPSLRGLALGPRWSLAIGSDSGNVTLWDLSYESLLATVTAGEGPAGR